MTPSIGIAGAVVALVGAALFILGGSVAVTATGLALLGIGGVAAVSGAFLVIGQSEDRDRERHGPVSG